MMWKNDQVSEVETAEIRRLARMTLEIKGDYVELGCYKGDTALMLAEILSSYNRGENGGKDVENPANKSVEKSVEKMGKSGEKVVRKSVNKLWKNSERAVERCLSENDRPDVDSRPVKKLWIYDSFEGLPEKKTEDESVMGKEFKQGELYVTKREVKERFLRAGLPVPIIKKAWFKDLTPDDMPSRIAFAFLDGDFYESIRDSLYLVEKCMANGGIIAVHDYNNPALPGVRKAMDEWQRNKNLRISVVKTMAVVVF